MKGGGEGTRHGATGGGRRARGGRIRILSAEVSEVSPCGRGSTVSGIHDGVMVSTFEVPSARRRPKLVEQTPLEQGLLSISLRSTSSELRATPEHRR